MKGKPFTKKIIAGKFKGKTLKLPSKATTRSSKGIVLESFFNTLQYEIIDATFVELFSGSGSIGLEALSRGAEQVIFMEMDRAAQKVLKENIAQTDPERCEIVAGDSFVNIDHVITQLKRQKCKAYFYIDPPFSIREGHEDIYEKTVNLITSLPDEVVKMIIVEHMTGLELADQIGIHIKIKSKKFGKTSLTYYS